MAKEKKETKKQPSGNVKHIVLIVAMALLLGVSAFIFSQQSDDDTSSDEAEVAEEVPTVEVCSEELITRANDAFAPEDVEELSQIVAEIEALENYDQDINCLYALANYYINVSNAQRAEEVVNALEPRYDPVIGYSLIYGSITETVTPENMRQTIDFLNNVEDQYLEDVAPLFQGDSLEVEE